MIQTSGGAYLLIKPTNPVLVSSISEGSWAVNCYQALGARGVLWYKLGYPHYRQHSVLFAVFYVFLCCPPSKILSFSKISERSISDTVYF